MTRCKVCKGCGQLLALSAPLCSCGTEQITHCMHGTPLYKHCRECTALLREQKAKEPA